MVQDGKITTTAGVTSGVFGALRLVQQLTSATEAQRVGRELAYPGWSLDGPTVIPAQRPAPRDLTNLIAALAPWRRPALGVGLVEGASEIDVAAPFEVYASSFAARTVPIAARPAAKSAGDASAAALCETMKTLLSCPGRDGFGRSVLKRMVCASTISVATIERILPV